MPTRPQPTPPNIDAFIAFAKDDDLGMVVKCHIALEVVLNRALASVLPENRSDLSRLPFMTRVDLAIAFDKVPDYLREGYRQANTIRNRFAHRLDATLTDDDAKAMLDTFTEDVWDGMMFRAYRAVLNEEPKQQVAFGFATLFLHSAGYTGQFNDILGELPSHDEAPAVT